MGISAMVSGSSGITYQQTLEAIYADSLPSSGDYVRVPTNLFVEKVDVNMAALPQVALYQMDEHGEPKILKAAEQGFSPLALSLHDFVWVSKKDMPQVRRYAEGALLADGQDPSRGMPVEKRMEILRRSAITVVDDLFQNPSRENIQRSSKVVGSFVHVLMKDPKAYLHLAKLSSHDPYTLQHSVGAGVNSIILARKVGINNERDLHEVGLAGLLHDIGKVKVKKEIINKPGPLDEAEWEEMRLHSAAGYDIVKDNESLTERTKRAILEHHEDKIGTGYPNKLKFDQIDVFSKIVGLSDVFNALTTNRSYSKARTPFEAFALIRDKMKHKIDEELFKQLVLVYGGKLDELTK